MFVGFTVLASDETMPPTSTNPMWMPSRLYTLCSVSTKFRCAVLVKESEKNAGYGSLWRKPLVTMREGFADGEDFASACKLGMAHLLTRYKPIVVVYMQLAILLDYRLTQACLEVVHNVFGWRLK